MARALHHAAVQVSNPSAVGCRSGRVAISSGQSLSSRNSLGLRGDSLECDGLRFLGPSELSRQSLVP